MVLDQVIHVDYRDILACSPIGFDTPSPYRAVVIDVTDLMLDVFVLPDFLGLDQAADNEA